MQNGIDAVNFRTIRESKSMDFDRQITAVAGSPKVQTPGRGEGGEHAVADNPFGDFNSMSRFMDGDD